VLAKVCVFKKIKKNIEKVPFPVKFENGEIIAKNKENLPFFMIRLLCHTK
jgi:hypothetical protein